VAARAAGVCADAARLLAPCGEGRDEALVGRARRALRYTGEHGAEGVYLLYPLSEFSRLEKGDGSYREKFEATWKRIGPYGAFSRFAASQLSRSDYEGGGRVMVDFITGYLDHDNADPELVKLAATWLRKQADAAARGILESQHGHRNARGSGPPGWGQATVMGRYLDPIMACLMLESVPVEDEQRYFDAMSVAADYVLGANPLGMVFITGLGTVSPLHPLHLDSLVFVKRGKGPMPGIPVYGPVDALPQASFYEPGRAAFYPRFERHPVMRRYADIRTFIKTYEWTGWECQEPHAARLALLVDGGERPANDWKSRTSP
jgi:hypothetical protein